MNANQLPLAIQLNDEATFDDFFWSAENALVRGYLMSFLTSTSDTVKEKLVYLWGKQGSGKSHILQACVQQFAHDVPAIYLPLKSVIAYGPGVLEGLESQTLLCLDDIDIIAQNPDFEEALFHLYNRIRDTGNTLLLMSGSTSPQATPIQLPDLRSRLGGSLVLQLHALSDDDKIACLCLRAKQRGLELSEHAAQFLVSRCARDMPQLKQLLDTLDEASWTLHQKLTIPFIKKVLNI